MLLKGEDDHTIPVRGANETLPVTVGLYLKKIIELVCTQQLYQEHLDRQKTIRPTTILSVKDGFKKMF